MKGRFEMTLAISPTDTQMFTADRTRQDHAAKVCGKRSRRTLLSKLTWPDPGEDDSEGDYDGVFVLESGDRLGVDEGVEGLVVHDGEPIGFIVLPGTKPSSTGPSSHDYVTDLPEGYGDAMSHRAGSLSDEKWMYDMAAGQRCGRRIPPTFSLDEDRLGYYGAS